MKQTVSGNIKCFDISCSDEDIEKSMNRKSILDTILQEKDKEIKRLNNKIKEQNLLLIEFQDMEQKLKLKDNIINELEKYAQELFDNPSWASCGARHILEKLKELKESGNNE